MPCPYPMMMMMLMMTVIYYDDASQLFETTILEASKDPNVSSMLSFHMFFHYFQTNGLSGE